MDFKGMAGAQGREIPLDIRFGESQVPLMCSSCNRMHTMGFWVIAGQKPNLICIKCSAAAIVKLQDLHPDLQLFEVDVNVDPKELEPAVKAVRGLLPELSESKALEVAKAALYAIG